MLHAMSQLDRHPAADRHGLERFMVKRNIIHPLLAISFINFILMLVVLIMSTTIFATPSGVAVKFPASRETQVLRDNRWKLSLPVRT